MSNLLLLDTNAYLDFVRVRKWLHQISTARKVFVPFFVVAELRSGFLHGTRFEENELRFEEFMGQGNVSALLPDLRTSHFYSLAYRELRTKGIHIPQNDLWIAALALQHGLRLCTSDSHFDHIPQLLRARP